MDGVQTVMPLHFYPYCQTRCPNETKRRILVRMSTLSHYLNFSYGLPLIQYGATHAEHVYQTIK